MAESRVAMMLRRFKEGESIFTITESVPHLQFDVTEDVIRAYLLGVDAARKAEGK